MSETAQTLIKAALRSIGAIATGETPTSDELADGLEALRVMLRNWSSQNIRVYFTTTESVTLTGATSYTWGTTGTIATARPVSIRGAYTSDNLVNIIGEADCSALVVANQSGPVQWLWYSHSTRWGICTRGPWTHRLFTFNASSRSRTT